MNEHDAAEDALGPTQDVVFLALTRPTVKYRVPMAGFMVAFAASCYFFVFEKLAFPGVNVFARMGLAGLMFLAAMAAMVRLSSWEPHFYRILKAWSETRLRQLLKPWTRVFGGTTYSPVPVHMRRDRTRLRAYAG